MSDSSEEDLIESLFPEDDKIAVRKRYKARKERERRTKAKQSRIVKSSDSDTEFDINLIVNITNESSDSEEFADVIENDPHCRQDPAFCTNTCIGVNRESPEGSTIFSDLQDYNNIECMTDREDYVNTSEEEDICRIEYIEAYISDSDIEEESHAWIDTPASPDAPGTLWNDMRCAVLKTNMTTNQTDSVLGVLHKHLNLTDKLPKCEKTLCKSNTSEREIIFKRISGHNYYYFGLENQIKTHLALFPSTELDKLDVLTLTWNNDGLPIFKSTRESAWPILVLISNLKPKKVFPVTLTVGEGKPTDLHYLD